MLYIKYSIQHVFHLKIYIQNYNYGACLDQPIPPMIRANDYVEVNTDDMNIVIKGLVNFLVERFHWLKIAIGQHF